MRVTISSTISENIDSEYIEESKKLLEFLATNGCDLNWGSGSVSIMGACYDVFNKYNRKIYGYVTPKYFFDIENLPNAEHKKYPDTLALKRDFLKDADLYISLPGGIGTISEFFSFLEEARSNDDKTPIVLYNINNHFEKTMELIDDLVERKFNSTNVYNSFKLINSLDEFKEYFNSLNK